VPDAGSDDPGQRAAGLAGIIARMLSSPRAAPRVPARIAFLLFFSLTAAGAEGQSSWSGVLRDAAGQRLGGAVIELRAPGGARRRATTSASGEFVVSGIAPGSYQLTVSVPGRSWKARSPLEVKERASFAVSLRLTEGPEAQVVFEEPQGGDRPSGQSSGGERLSSEEVSSLPLNERDFSKLLLLAAGTMTDTNGAANFTQQFSVNGQRGSASVFALDGADTTDPELGGATFANFNVDAIQEVSSNSGVMAADIGHGAAGYTDVISKSGTDQTHGSAFEFVRNAAFDARNFFDRASGLDRRRIPPFARNEFGVTNGGPLRLPRIYNGTGKTYYFAEYQGFRQVLGTTQVLPVPTEAERNGIDTTTFPGDTLTVPVDPAVASILARYPLPNEPQGAYGARTYATSSKVATTTDQFSIRIDHRISEQHSLTGRFSLNQVGGPTTNPDQTAIDPSFGVRFFDHQRNATVRYVRAITPRLSSTAQFGYIRSTPFFPTVNHTQPAITFNDGLYAGFNNPDGSIFGSFGNLYQLKEDMSYVRGAHRFKWGVEIRFNKDATIFGTNPNGLYAFGGGTAYAPVSIPSTSGQHDIRPGDKLPDALTGFLTATPFSYTITAPASVTPAGDKFDEASVRREAYNFYVLDAWKAGPRLSVNYGLRFELNSRIKESQHRTSIAIPVDAGGKETSFTAPGARQMFVYNPQPAYPLDRNGWGPRLSLDFAATPRTSLHAGGALTTLLPNLWLENFLTGGFPLTFQPIVTALPGVPVAFSGSLVNPVLPDPYAAGGRLLFPDGDSSRVPANTVIDLERYQSDLAALTPGHEVQLFVPAAVSRRLQNGYLATYTFGIERQIGSARASAAYVGVSGVGLPNGFFPNGYTGAEPAFAPFTQFDSAGRIAGGFGPEAVMTNGSHSSYHALQAGLTQNQSKIGLSLQASYTFSKSLDDTSAILGGPAPNSSVILQTVPQNPRDMRGERGPSSFDVTQVFTLSLFQALPFDRLKLLRPISRKLTGGWQILNITTLTSGPPFTVFSGVQQTGVGAGGADRPDLTAMPDFSTSRAVREDYFGLGASNSSFFTVPIGIPGGTGPNAGRFGTLGRSTFRGPGYRDFDFSVIKDTAFGGRGKRELCDLQFRAEFFNLFNVVNFGLPSNVLRGSGFGIISKTAGTSRQIQFSLKLIY
jgi:Carboxypeptidase regulatory-like domain